MKACFARNRRRRGSPGLPDKGVETEQEEKEEKAEEGAPPEGGGGTGEGSPAVPPPTPGALVEELEAARDLQRLHARERKKDLRSCQDCLRAARAMEQHLEALRDRLASAEARLLGLPPPTPPPTRHRRPNEDEGAAAGAIM